MDTQKYKIKLQEEKERLIKKKAFYQSEDPLLTQDRESSYSFDDDTAEEEGHDRIVAMNEGAEDYIKEIENALSKIEKGTYGICEDQGEQISEERLAAYPAARYCIKCQKER